jgi:hypothetical protein
MGGAGGRVIDLGDLAVDIPFDRTDMLDAVFY